MPDQFISAQKAGAPAGDRCILLFGLPRSGTTWLGKLFDSHPDTLYRHEPDTAARLQITHDPGAPESGRHVEEIRAFAAQLPAINALRVAGKRPLFAKSYLSAPRRYAMTAAIELARVGSRISPEFPVLIGPSRRKSLHPVVVWKSIQSLSRIGLVLDALPAARGIHILRHPCGYVASVRRGLASKRFSHNSADDEVYGLVRQIKDTAFGRRYGFGDDFQSYLYALTPEERIAWRWVLVNDKARHEAGDNARYMAVRYEDICADPLYGVRRMFDFAGLAMNEQTRAFATASTGETRAGYYSVFKNPEAAAWRWREELDDEVVARVMAIVARSDTGVFYSADAIETAPVA